MVPRLSRRSESDCGHSGTPIASRCRSLLAVPQTVKCSCCTSALILVSRYGLRGLCRPSDPPSGSMMEKPAAASSVSGSVAVRQATRPPKYARLRQQEGTGVKRTQGITGTRSPVPLPLPRSEHDRNPRGQKSKTLAYGDRASESAEPGCWTWTRAEATNMPRPTHTERPCACAWNSEHSTEPAVRLNHGSRTGPHSELGIRSLGRFYSSQHSEY